MWIARSAPTSTSWLQPTTSSCLNPHFRTSMGEAIRAMSRTIRCRGVSNSRFQDLDGLIGFLHVPDPTIPTLDLTQNSNTFLSIQGPVLKVYFFDSSTVPTYTYNINQNSLSNIYQTQLNTGAIKIFSNSVEATLTVNFMWNTVENIQAS